jgi:parallel beta-helix repeat protein
VIVGNGFAFTQSAWGANAGISISSSPYCRVERNLLIGNKEGLSLREQNRSTPLIERGSEPVWNHNQAVHNNVFAYNRDAQVWGWFDIDDERHWPKSMQEGSANKQVQTDSNSAKGPPAGLELVDLQLNFRDNIYCPGPGQGLFNWGVTWKRNKRYKDLETVHRELSLARGCRIVDIGFKDLHKLDLRISINSQAMKMQCYPKGNVPGVRLGTYSQ